MFHIWPWNKICFFGISLKLTFMHYFSNIEVEYPCEFGFEYMIAGAAVWLCFLPCYLVTLLGNCWRQCCCCLCDPLVRYKSCAESNTKNINVSQTLIKTFNSINIHIWNISGLFRNYLWLHQKMPMRMWKVQLHQSSLVHNVYFSR